MSRKIAGTLLAMVAIAAMSASAAHAWQPQVILGPGLDAGRTPFHQNYHRTLFSDTTYILTGLYYVDSTFTITIPAGTTVLGDTAATLIVARGAQIFATGTADNPIVFTSLKPAGQRDRGDWGGVILLGEAPCNKTNPLIEGGIIGGTYGGTDSLDSSGILRYCRIEYPGYRFQLNNEVNGLTMGAVGAGTELHHVQVSYAFDDSYEWFGGTVNCSCLVAFGGTDDEFDSDFGYQGKLQFCFGYRDQDQWDPNGESNGFESDNDGTGSPATPLTAPVFSNVTLVGPERIDSMVGNLPPGHKFQYGAVLRRNTRNSVFNSAILGYPWGLSLRDGSTQGGAGTGTLQLRDLTWQASAIAPSSTTIDDENRWAIVSTWFCGTPAWANGFCPRNTGLPSAVMLTNLNVFNNPDPTPAPGSPLIGTADFTWPMLSDPFFKVVTYRGAFDPNLPMSQQWTAGWTNFDPQNEQYLDVEGGVVEIARSRVMLENYPNPFNPVTTIRYSIPASGRISLKVYNIQGQEVATLVDGNASAGIHEAVFTTSELPSGTYFYRLSGNGFEATEKMVLLK